MTRIAIPHRTGAIYDVIVDDGRGTTRHEVTVWRSDVARYAPDATPEALLEAKEAILRKFELPVIEQYFPEYRDRIARMLE